MRCTAVNMVRKSVSSLVLNRAVKSQVEAARRPGPSEELQRARLASSWRSAKNKKGAVLDGELLVSLATINEDFGGMLDGFNHRIWHTDYNTAVREASCSGFLTLTSGSSHTLEIKAKKRSGGAAGDVYIVYSLNLNLIQISC